jgi:hypothetical protein
MLVYLYVYFKFHRTQSECSFTRIGATRGRSSLLTTHFCLEFKYIPLGIYSHFYLTQGKLYLPLIVRLKVVSMVIVAASVV